MARFSRSFPWQGANSDIWKPGDALTAEEIEIPRGPIGAVTTSQEILLANSPIGGGEGYGTSTLWYPNPWNRTPSDPYVSFGTLLSGVDFFPFYRNGVFWSPRRISRMLMNGILIDSQDPNHENCFELPSDSSKGFYRIVLLQATPSNTFNAIINLTPGQTLALTEITLYNP